jgi:putative transposase
MANGRRFRILNVVDDVTHECLASIPDTSISGHRVSRELAALIERRGRPGMIVSDNVLRVERWQLRGQDISSCKLALAA